MIGKQFKDDNRITSYRTLIIFMTAGNGKIDLVAPSGKSHQYLFKKPVNYRDFPRHTIFVYGIHEDHKYYLGMLTNTLEFKRTANSSFLDDTEIMQGAYYLSKLVKNKKELLNCKMKVYNDGRCPRCRRPLTPETLKKGIGKKCSRKYWMEGYSI